MWNLSVPWWELILRGIVVYVFLIALLRLTGKRQVGQLAPFDLVLLSCCRMPCRTRSTVATTRSWAAWSPRRR